MDAKHQVAVGDKVRSFDFSYRDLTGPYACYIEGEVLAIIARGESWSGEGETNVCFGDCSRYVIKLSRTVCGGEDIGLKGLLVYPPVNGTPTLFDRVCDGVERIA